MALTDLTNPDDPYRKSLESALYNRQADVINTKADEAQRNSRENAFANGVGFSSILPDYSTAPIERERLRALTSASQNAFLGAGQEARANAGTTNQASQFAQSQAQQAAQFNQQMANQRAALSQQANQNLIANLGGGAMGLATLLLRPQGQGQASTSLGGNLADWLMKRGGQGVDYLSSLWGGQAPSAGAGIDTSSLNLPNFTAQTAPGFGITQPGFGVMAPETGGSTFDLSGIGGGNGLGSLDLTDPAVLDALFQIQQQTAGL